MSTGEPSEVLNLSRLEMSAGGDRALMLELAELYLQDTGAKLPSLVEAARDQELFQVGRVAHGLKGASASLGCDEAAEAFRNVEEIGRAGDVARLEDADYDGHSLTMLRRIAVALGMRLELRFVPGGAQEAA